MLCDTQDIRGAQCSPGSSMFTTCERAYVCNNKVRRLLSLAQKPPEEPPFLCVFWNHGQGIGPARNSIADLVCVRTRTSTPMMRNRGKYLCCKFTCRPARSVCAAPGLKFRARVVCTTCAKTHTLDYKVSLHIIVYPSSSGYKRTFHMSITQQALRGAVLNLNQNKGYG